MTKRKKPTLGRALINLVIGVPTLLSLTGRIGSLIGFEARLASQSLVGIIMLAIFSALLLTSAWLCLLAMLFVYLSSLHWSPLLVLLALFGLNLILLLIVCRRMTKYKKRLLFPKTRDLLDEVRGIYEEL